MERQQEINSRTLYIKSLNEFLVTANHFLSNTLQELGWKESSTVTTNSEKPMVTCPLDPGHRLNHDNLERHVEKCRWHRLGYQDDDVPFPPCPVNLPTTAVIIDKTLQRNIILKAASKDQLLKIGVNVDDREVPQTCDRFFSDFTTDERRVLYDYVVAETAAAVPRLNEFNLTARPEGQSAPMTKEQLMAAERDAKRRRVKHRAAKVHTRSKNYSEVLREVINNQMLAYEDWIKENFGEHLPESVQPEMRKNEEAKQEKQEMVWLDDCHGNPHIRWKYILEKEKRQKEREEKNGKNRDKEREKNHSERKRDKGESSSRKHHHKEKYRRNEDDDELDRDIHHDQAMYDHEVSHRRRKGNEPSRRDSHFSSKESRHSSKESHHSKRERHSLKRETHSRDREEKYEEKRSSSKKHKKHKHHHKSKHREKKESKYDPNVEGVDRGGEHGWDKRKKKRKWDRYDGYPELEQGIRIKDEKSEFPHSHKYYKSDLVKMEYDAKSTDSEYD